MKWILLLVLIVGGYFAYQHFAGNKSGGGSGGGTPEGIGNAFLDAAKAGDDAKIRGLAEPEAANQAVEIAHKVAPLNYTSAPWHSTRPESGDGAVQAQLSGAGKAITLEYKNHGDKKLISSVALSDF